MSWKGLAIAFVGGELGDTADWRLAMERWESDGVRIADLSYVPRNNLPFDSNIAKQGFPAFSFQGDTRSDVFEVELFDQLLALYKLDSPVSSKMLLSNSIMILVSLTDEGVYFPEHVCEALPEVVVSSVLDWVDMTMLNHIPDAFWSSPKMFDLLSALLSKCDVWVYDSLDVKIDRLKQFVERNANFKDGIILLSKMAKVGREINLPFSISVIEATEDYELREAYILVALSRLDCDPSDALRMAELLDEMAASTKGANYLYCAIEMLRESSEVTRATETFLYSIFSKEISKGYGSQRDITSLLKQHQAYHLSHDSEMLR